MASLSGETPLPLVVECSTAITWAAGLSGPQVNEFGQGIGGHISVFTTKLNSSHSFLLWYNLYFRQHKPFEATLSELYDFAGEAGRGGPIQLS